MIGIALAIGFVGLFLSAFFSGSEIGFYRVTRMRLVLDAKGGDPVARGLLWLTNHPSLFVATVLVGNNLANYLTSLAIVMGTQTTFARGGHLAELIAPVVLSPLLFVYGELLPKYLFLHAPNRLLHRSGPLYLLLVPLFFPVSGLLWGLNRLLAGFVSESPEQVRLRIARRELRRALEEGREAGILYPSQIELAQGIFAVANHPVGRYAVALSDLPRARSDMTKDEVLRLAARLTTPDVPVEAGTPPRLVGYVRVIDLRLDPSDELRPVRPLLRISHTDTHISALTRMHSAGESLAEVVDSDGKTIGILTARRLREPLLRGGQ